jgi:SAM-dependent methyltransferase
MKQRAAQIAAGLLAVGLVLGLWELSERGRERRHAKRPDAVTDRLLQLARLSASDRVYDLECGDGGVVVAAAQRSGARGWCFDIYPRRLAEARERARRAGVEGLITFQQQFWDTVDVSPATVVILQITNPTGHMGNYKLCGQLTRELRPGSRIVSAGPGLGDWKPAAVASAPALRPNERFGEVKLWVTDGTVRRCLE